jgi:hypothetical protein
MIGNIRILAAADRACARKPRIADNGRMATLALIAGLPLVVLLALSAPARQAALAEHDPDRIACARVYDSVACSCAVAATIAAEPASLGVSADAPPLRRVDATRVPIAMTADFVRRVQACMAGGASAPID